MKEKKKKRENTKKITFVRSADPFYERERQKYDNPLPSREYIEQILEAHGIPMSFQQLTRRLSVTVEEERWFERRLRAMEREGQLLRNRRDAYILPDKADLFSGKIAGHPDGYGFIIRDKGGDDVFLNARAMRGVFHGDRVMARIIGKDGRGRPEGCVVEVLERAHTQLVGRVRKVHGVWLVSPEDKRIAHDILIAAENRKRIKEGNIVELALIQQPSRSSQPVGRIVKVLGDYADPGMEIEIALRKHELPYTFSAEAKAEAGKLPRQVRKKDKMGREDITYLPLVTIDGETARDFDDAVYCECQGKGFRLLVAIADVGHYVPLASALDQAAQERGNSVYFPRRVIPMLPEKLSNNLCSLMPTVERLCMVCDMNITPTGRIKNYRFYPAVMFSHARLTYTEVAAALYDKAPEVRQKLGDLLPHLEALDQVFRIFLKARQRRGAIEFDSSETQLFFNDDGKIERIAAQVRNDAHRLIEECMLAANVCAADFLTTRNVPGLYRVHDSPSDEKLEKLRLFLKEFGLSLGGGDAPDSKDVARLLQQIHQRPDAALLQTVLLRSLRQATYSPDNKGHFGLAYDGYAHFTSPIRRYPDLVVHRAIKAALCGAPAPVAASALEALGEHCSATERRADDATREVVAWLKCYYMQDRIGEVFCGSISAVVPFGLFVTLDEVFVEGLLHISDLGSDYFHFDEVRHLLRGERTGISYRLSERVEVQLVRVDLESKKIDFRLAQNVVISHSVSVDKTALGRSTDKNLSQSKKDRQRVQKKTRS